MKFFRCLLRLIAVTAIIVTQKATAIISPKISVQYIVEYSDDRCSTAPDPAQATTKVPAGSVALIVMQEAANDDSQLRFTATYFGSDLGYYIDAINGTSTDSENSCYWLIYVRYPNGTESLSPLGVSSYVLPGTGYSLIWRYTRTYDTSYVPDAETQSLTNAFEPVNGIEETVKYQSGAKVMVSYVIDYQNQDVCGPGLVAPPQVDVKIPIQGSAQQVLEKSVDYGREYRFTATFFNHKLGYFVDAINGTSGNVKTNCFWLFYIRLPKKPKEFLPNVGVSNYVIPADGFTVIMRYQIAEHVPAVALKGLADDQTQPRMLVSILMIVTLFTTIMIVY